MKSQRRWWLIGVSDYGRFAFFGTDAEAEEMRQHKAHWEGGTAVKEKLDPRSSWVTKERNFLKAQQATGVPCDERTLEAIQS